MTVKDIWDEKPIPFYTAPPGGEGVYHTEKMDTWLEKLKAEFDRLQKEGLEHHAIAVEYYEKLEAVRKIMIEAESDDPYVGEAMVLQKIADELGVEKQFEHIEKEEAEDHE